MNVFLTVVLAVLSSSSIATIVVACLQRHWAKKDKKDERIDALVEAQKVIMIDRVRYLAKNYIKQGFIAIEDKENILAMYSAYKALGGNGHLATIMEEVRALEVRG